MFALTLKERYEQLWAELDDLVEKLTPPDAYPLCGPDGGAPDDALLAEKKRLRQEWMAEVSEKTAELRRVHARMQSPYYRFHEVSAILRGVLWISAVPLTLLALFFFIPLGEWLMTFASGFLLVWAVWSSIPIKA